MNMGKIKKIDLSELVKQKKYRKESIVCFTIIAVFCRQKIFHVRKTPHAPKKA